MHLDISKIFPITAIPYTVHTFNIAYTQIPLKWHSVIQKVLYTFFVAFLLPFFMVYFYVKNVVA